MPATISINFTNQAEVQGANPPDNKSVSASVLRSVLNAGLITGGYVTLAGTETITGAKTFSAGIAATTATINTSVKVGVGSNGYVRLNNGTSTKPGYLAWYTPGDVRRGYVGWESGDTDNITFNLENGWGLLMNSPSKPVVIQGELSVSTSLSASESVFNTSVKVGVGPNGYARLNNGNATKPGYLAWHTPDNVRRGYVGWESDDTENISFNLENGWGLVFNSPSKPVVIQGDLTVTGDTIGIIPVGAVMGFFTSAPPSGWLHLNGAATLSRTLYPNLWAHAQASGNIVTQAAWNAGRFGSFHTGDTTNTFGIPWTLGAFLRGWDSGGGIDSGRVIGSYQADGIKDHSHSGTTGTESANHTHNVASAGSRYGENGTGPSSFFGSMGDVGNGNRPSLTTTGISQNHTHSFSSTNALAGATPDTRPPNVPILYCIKF